MNRIYVFALFFALLTMQDAQAQYFVVPVPTNIYTPGVTLQQTIDSITANLSPADTGEGGPRDQMNEFNQFWQNRVVSNDATASSSTRTNMFSQYFATLNSATLARTTSSCGSGGFQGNWQVVGKAFCDNICLASFNRAI
jgi:hypothetical protein